MSALACLTLAGLAVAGDAPKSPTPEPAPYVRRGDEVEARYRQYGERLEKAYQALKERLAEDAPDLHKKLTAPPQRLEYGYQLLPELGPDPPLPDPLPPVKPSRYSWPRTLGFIDTEEHQIWSELEDRLIRLPDSSLEDRRQLCEAMVEDYPALRSDYRLVDRHIQHNRLWQSSVAKNEAAYAHGTRLFHVVEERQAIIEALEAKDEDGFREALSSLEDVDPARPRSELTPELEAREQRLLERIRAAGTRPYVRDFITLRQDGPGSWVIHVPMNTDIEDDGFLRGFEQAVESHWRASDGDTMYRVEITLHKITTAELYAGECKPDEADRDGSEVHCRVPKKGDALDIDKHVRLFPADRAALTTGDTSTVVRGEACIILGPEPSTARRLAHEFGHVLGFKDDYFRGFADLGDDGYEILEISPDHADIMSSPGYGSVLPYHFQALMGVLREAAAATGP